jgi:putative colanic acid biosynthesis acetyltransferase WcaF
MEIEAKGHTDRKQIRLETYSTSGYNPGNKVKIMVWYLINMLFFKSSFPYPLFFKRFLLRLFQCKAGKHVRIKPCVSIKYPWLLSMGDYSGLGEGVWVDNLARVIIADHVYVSQGAYLLTGNHDYTKTSFDLIVKNITIETGVWVGAKAIICPGVTLGSHSVITAGSVVTKDTKPYTVYQGNPAQAVRERTIE